VPRAGRRLSRIALWRDSLPLIQDYFFTGSGLGATAMIYATYAYLLHVPYLYHAHNLYVQIALEQGVPALLAWLGLMAATSGLCGARVARCRQSGAHAVDRRLCGADRACWCMGCSRLNSILGPSGWRWSSLPPALLAWSAASVYTSAAELDRDEWE
jgi:hypothetical protein